MLSQAMIMQLLAVLLLRLGAALASTPLHYLNATAIVSDSNGNARIQCWQFKAPFQTYPTVGMAIHLGQVSNLTYVALPPRSKEGLHKPPHPMYVSRQLLVLLCYSSDPSLQVLRAPFRPRSCHTAQRHG